MDTLLNYYRDWSLKTKKNMQELIISFGIQALATLLVCWLVFYLIGLRYSFLKALLIAISSILPVVSAGLVFVPWSLLRFVQNDLTIAGRLAMIYVFLMVCLKIIKPYLLGKTEGIRPYIYFVLFIFLYSIFYIKGAVIAAVLIFILIGFFDLMDIQTANRRYKRYLSRQKQQE